jgi:hypothetical protein
VGDDGQFRIAVGRLLARTHDDPATSSSTSALSGQGKGHWRVDDQSGGRRSFGGRSRVAGGEAAVVATMVVFETTSSLRCPTGANPGRTRQRDSCPRPACDQLCEVSGDDGHYFTNLLRSCLPIEDHSYRLRGVPSSSVLASSTGRVSEGGVEDDTVVEAPGSGAGGGAACPLKSRSSDRKSSLFFSISL